MRFSVIALTAAAAAVQAQSSTIVAAPTVSSNPQGASYVAMLPEKGTVRGSIVGTSGEDGTGVKFEISVSGLPEEGGPFMYHIHEKPISADGNCTSAGAHLDPYKRGEVPPCDPSKKETCQTGDLSGKFRNLTGPADSDSYLDPFSSTNPMDPAYFGDKSIVVHFSNKTRISCANFTLVEGGASPSPSSGYAMPSGTHSPNGTHPTGMPTPSLPSDNGAGSLMVAGGAMLAGAFALIL